MSTSWFYNLGKLLHCGVYACTIDLSSQLKQKYLVGKGTVTLSLAIDGYRYHGRSRERRGRRGTRTDKLKLFGMSREVDPYQSSDFMGILGALPALTDGRLYKDEIEIPRMQLSTIRLFSSAISEKRKKTFEQKNVNQLPSAIKSSLNGRGSGEVVMDLTDFVPTVIASRGKYIGTLLVRRTAESFAVLDEVNRSVHRKIHEATETASNKKSLPPRIDLYKVSDLASAEAGREVLGSAVDIIREKRGNSGEIIKPAISVPIVMEPAEEYWVRPR